jgi:hypothetical protein
MTYKIHPIRFAGKIQSYVVTIDGKTFVQGKNSVTIYGDGFKRTVNNSWYSDIKTESL